MKNPPKGFIEDNIELLSYQTAFEELVPKALKFDRCYVTSEEKFKNVFFSQIFVLFHFFHLPGDII